MPWVWLETQSYHLITIFQQFWEDLTRHRLTKEEEEMYIVDHSEKCSSDPQYASQSQFWCCQVSMETASVVWTCCEDGMVIVVCQHYVLHHFHSEFSSSALEEVVVVLKQSSLHLTQHLVVISLMSRVSTSLGLDFVQVEAWRERGALLAVKQGGKEGQLAIGDFCPKNILSFGNKQA